MSNNTNNPQHLICPKCNSHQFFSGLNSYDRVQIPVNPEDEMDWVGSELAVADGDNDYTCSKCNSHIDYEKSRKEGKIILISEEEHQKRYSTDKLREISGSINLVNLSEMGDLILITNAPNSIIIEIFKISQVDKDIQAALTEKGYFAILQETYDPYYDPEAESEDEEPHAT